MGDLPDIGDLEDHEDAELGADLGAGERAAEAAEREDQDRAMIDVLQGLREVRSTEPVWWTIERIDGDGPTGLLAKWPTSILKWEKIRDEFGPGTYRIEGRTIAGAYVKRRTVTIAGDAPRRVKDVSAPVSSFNLAEFMAAQEARDVQRRREEADQRKRDEEREERRRQERREDRKELATILGPPLLGMIGQIFGGRGSDPLAIAAALRPPAPPDPLQMLVALRQLDAPKGPTPIDQSMQLVELILDKAGNSDKTTMLDVVKEGVKIMGPTIGGAIEQTIAQARANAAAAVAPQQSSGMQVDVHAPPAQITTEQARAAGVEESMLDLLPHLSWLKERLGEFVAAAARGRDPQLYAAMFLEKLTETTLAPQRILELLSRSDWFTQLQSFDARISQQPPQWWMDLRASLVGMIQEALQPPAPAPKRRVVSGTAPPQGVERPQGPVSLTESNT